MSNSKLIILRGNSGSGKSTVAKCLREVSDRKIAYVEQDTVRRSILKEKETNDGLNIELIRQITEFSLNHNYDVILEGILKSYIYGRMLHELTDKWSDHYIYYFDIPFEETLSRHVTKPNAHEFGETEMKEWYRAQDYIGIEGEKVVSKDSTLDQTIEMIMQDAGL